MSRVLLRVSLLACLLLAACGPKRPPRPPDHAQFGVLLPTSQLGDPFIVQQRLTGQYGSREFALDCVVQLSQGKLTVLGLTPMGTKAFAIEQQGTEVSFQKFIDRDVPIEPERVLYDLHRVFFRGLSRPQAPGTHREQDHGEMVTEHWQGGHVVERRFEALEGPVSNIIIVHFEGPPAPVIAREVRLTNVAFGYTLQIENVEQKLLEQGYTLEVETDKVERSE